MSDDDYTQEVFIYKGEDLRRIAELKKTADTAERAYAQAVESGTARGGDSGHLDAREALREAVNDAATRAETVVVQHLGKTRWRALLAQHRPRYIRRMIDGQLQDVMDDDDAQFNVNTDSFPDALLSYVDPSDTEVRTILEPEFATPADRAKWLEKLRGGDFDKLWAVAYFLNSQQTIDPKALLDSLSSSPA